MPFDSLSPRPTRPTRPGRQPADRLQQRTPAPDSTLHSKAQHSTIQLQGVPGGVYTKVESITATVTAIDYQSRQVSLQDPLGNQRTLHAGP